MAGARKRKGEGKLGAHETHEARERGSGCSQCIVYSVFLVRRRTKNRHWFVCNYASIIASLPNWSRCFGSHLRMKLKMVDALERDSEAKFEQILKEILLS